MAKTSTKSAASSTPVDDNFDPSVFGLSQDDLVEVGAFPPYVSAVEGFAFYAKPLAVDRTDPEFPRILWQALAPLTAFRGPKDNQIEVPVGVGELFTSSEYGAMRSRITEAWEGCGVVVRFLEELPHPTAKGQTFWKVSMQMPKKDHELMMAQAKALGPEAAARSLGRYQRLGGGALIANAAPDGTPMTGEVQDKNGKAIQTAAAAS